MKSFFKKALAISMIASIAFFALPLPAMAAASPSSWAEEQVGVAIAQNLVPPNLQSHYTQAITRAEFCALAVTLYEFLMGEISGRASFVDTNDVNVEKAAYIGIISGVGDNRFDPAGTLTREQAAVMLSRLAEALGSPLPAQEVAFADNGSIASWAIDGVGRVQAAGIMGGVGDNRFAPQQSYTREQSIVTIMRMLDIVEVNESLQYQQAQQTPQQNHQNQPPVETPPDAFILNRPYGRLPMFSPAPSQPRPVIVSQTLDAEQVQAFLPDLGFPVSVNAYYDGATGSFNNVQITEVLPNAFSSRATITIRRSDTTLEYRLSHIRDGTWSDYRLSHEPIISYVSGVPVFAIMIEYERHEGNVDTYHSAYFVLDGFYYSIRLDPFTTGEDGLNRLAEMISTIIRDGADFSVVSDSIEPVSPETQEILHSQDETQFVPRLGSFVPTNVPAGLSFNNAYVIMNPSVDTLFISWSSGFEYIGWRITTPTENDLALVVSVDERERFDLNLYPIPRGLTVPPELFEVVQHPVFLAEELTLEVVQTRAVPDESRIGEVAGASLVQMNFSVLFDDVIIRLDVRGSSAEQVWEMLQAIDWR